MRKTEFVKARLQDGATKNEAHAAWHARPDKERPTRSSLHGKDDGAFLRAANNVTGCLTIFAIGIAVVIGAAIVVAAVGKLLNLF